MTGRIIQRPIGVAMLSVAIVVLGMVAVGKLPVSLMPDVEIPRVTVRYDEASMAASRIEASVTAPLRLQMLQINGMEDMECESGDGVSILRLKFSPGTDMDQICTEVNEKVDQAMSFMNIRERPRVIKERASDIPAFYINLCAEDSADFGQVSRFGTQVLRRRLEQLPEVAMVDISGTEDMEIRIVPDMKVLDPSGLEAEDLAAALRRSDISLGAMTIVDGQYRYPLRMDSQSQDVESVRETLIPVGGRIMKLREVADVSIAAAKKEGFVLHEGRRAVSVAVIKRSGARMSDLRKSVFAQIEAFGKEYPQLSFYVTRDQTGLLSYSITNLIYSILLGIVLAFAVLIIFLRNLRNAVLVLLTIPVSFFLSFILFVPLGLSINIMSLSGLLIGAGMITDNTVILIDNIGMRLRAEKNLERAVISGTCEVAGPMLSSVLTTCAVFLPMVMMKGVAGALFRDQALAMSVVLLSSYAVTLILVPVYYYQSRKREPRQEVKKASSETLSGRIDSVLMQWFISHRAVSWAIIGLSAAGLVALSLGIPKERFPDLGLSDAVLSIEWNENISPKESGRRINEIMSGLSGVVTSFSAYGGTQDFMIGPANPSGPSSARLYLSCDDAGRLLEMKKKVSEMAARRWPLAGIEFGPTENVFDLVFESDEPPLRAKISSMGGHMTPDMVIPLKSDIEGKLGGEAVTWPGLRDEIVLKADMERMALLGTSLEDLAGELRARIAGLRVLSLSSGESYLPVEVGGGDIGLDGLLSTTITSGKGVKVPLSYLVSPVRSGGFRRIVSGPEGEYLPVEIQADANSAGEVMRKVKECVSRMAGLDVSFSGSSLADRKLLGGFAEDLLLALVLLFLILAIQFESLLQPFIILFEVVVDFFAAFAVLRLCGMSVNIMSLTGLVVVSGIVINDSILKIDTINKLHLAGMSLEAAVLEASSRRSRAIIMTSLTTVLSLVPLLAGGSMGANLQLPMAVVIISSMMVGTFVSLYVVPSLYSSFYASGR